MKIFADFQFLISLSNWCTSIKHLTLKSKTSFFNDE